MINKITSIKILQSWKLVNNGNINLKSSNSTGINVILRNFQSRHFPIRHFPTSGFSLPRYFEFTMETCVGCKTFEIKISFQIPDRKQINNSLQFSLPLMGDRNHLSAHLRPSAQPSIDMSGNFSAHMSAELPQNISPNP